MGRIRTGLIKRSANTLIKLNPGKFTKKFDENKKFVQELSDVSTKKLRNQIAGYLTKVMKTAED